MDCRTTPHDADAVINHFHYKIGTRGMTFQWRGEWRRSDMPREDIEAFRDVQQAAAAKVVAKAKRRKYLARKRKQLAEEKKNGK